MQSLLIESLEKQNLAKSFLAKIDTAFDRDGFTYQKAIESLATKLDLDDLGRLLTLTVAGTYRKEIK